ncbi:Gmad2 immunoglobulin-like domain-containing protein [Proteinivorax tanatarense]|uniref:Gmad2 immunoglobulin-like domain-containing protein n=1 Tax=Proteinivorax tanatarense TaxID=1260629 RepID=A0AAU7VMM9_9FIRM
MKSNFKIVVFAAILALVAISVYAFGPMSENDMANGKEKPNPSEGPRSLQQKESVKEDNGEFTEEIEFSQGFYRPDYSNLPQEIVSWVKYSQNIPVVQEKEYKGYRFLLITEGKKPTGGYDIEVEGVKEAEQRLNIEVNVAEPGPGEGATTAPTYPFDLVILENNELPFYVRDSEDTDKYFMRLVGLQELDRHIVAGSEWIKIFSPSPNENVKDSFNLTGIASVFEGTVNYELISEDGKSVYEGFTTAAMGDWGYFKEEISIPAEVEDQQLTLQLYSRSMKDGSKMFKVEIPLQ